jgi:nucleoid-associated protein YgaU
VTPAREDAAKAQGPPAAEWQMTAPHVSIRERTPKPVEAAADPSERTGGARDTVKRQIVLPTLEKVVNRAHGTIQAPPEEPSDDTDDSIVPTGTKGTARKAVKEVIGQAGDVLSDL